MMYYFHKNYTSHEKTPTVDGGYFSWTTS